MNDRIIERPKERLSFIQQLEDQINVCRLSQSDPKVFFTPKVRCLEALLWARLRKDSDYIEYKKQIQQKLEIEINNLKSMQYKGGLSHKTRSMCEREYSEKLFKAIMIFIDEKDYFGSDQ